MKKVMTAVAIALLSFSTIADAKRGGGMKVAKPKPTVSQQKPDATFNNTPPVQPQKPMAQQQQAQGNRLGNFITGAAAGYLLSDMLSPSEAQAQEANKATQAVGSEQNSANPVAQLNQQVQQMPTIQTFKSIDANDPNLIEKTAGYSRYCLNGVQYLISNTAAQLPPTLMVDKNNAPVQCLITK